MPESVLVGDVQSGGARIRYTVSGAAGAPALLLAHSLGASSEMWTPQLAPLEQHFRVIRYDARGHGGSSVPDGEYSLAELGGDALAVLDATATDRAEVCGISMGGQLAMWLAIHAPQRVERIVLANTAARIGSAQGWAERIDTVRTSGMASLAASVRGRWLTPEYADAHPDVAGALVARLIATSPAGYIGCCAAIRDADLSGDLARIAAPALVIGGEHDPATTIADAEALCAGLHDARLVRLSAAHLSNVEAADRFTRELTAFLEAERRFCTDPRAN